jgi:hypothetical protein
MLTNLSVLLPQTGRSKKPKPKPNTVVIQHRMKNENEQASPRHTAADMQRQPSGIGMLSDWYECETVSEVYPTGLACGCAYGIAAVANEI